MTTYFSPHRGIRRRINQADYPKITDEVTTLRFIVNGLEGRPKYRNEARAIQLSGLPKSVKIIENRLLEVEASTINTHHLKFLPQTVQSRGGNWTGNRGGIGIGNSYFKEEIMQEVTGKLKTEIFDQIAQDQGPTQRTKAKIRRKLSKTRPTVSYPHHT